MATQTLRRSRVRNAQGISACAARYAPARLSVRERARFRVQGERRSLATYCRRGRQVNRKARTNYRLYWEKLNAAIWRAANARACVFGRESRRTAIHFSRSTHGPANELISRVPALSHTGRMGRYRRPAGAVERSFRKALRQVGRPLADDSRGENYLWHTNRGGGVPLFGWRTRFWSFLLKLKKDQPSWTIQAQPGPATGPFHWCNRRLTAQELCRLQTFPDGLVFECGQNAVQRLLGNAVPSLLAEVLAREIRSQFFDNPCSNSLPRLLPPVRIRFNARSRSSRCRANIATLSEITPTTPAKGSAQGRAAAPRARLRRNLNWFP